ncbi:MAG: GTP 3',8-cyclase MoaA [Gemmatimonadetes bacterium]|nr:GTP 3',8-cyclase MoaA [Gemmatimonadota bacterium]
MRDAQGRAISYLRISVTDRCNFRCLYCMPVDGLEWLPKAEILTYEEIAEIVRQLAPAGIRRLRITGGEPTIRPDLEILIGYLKAIPGIQDVALSTNGVKLVKKAADYAAAGLDRVNMSADSLRHERIVQIARRDLGLDPIAALTAAERAGLEPVKVNMVVLRGINDDEVEDFARLTLDHPWHVRFIELMPVGEMASLTWDHVVPSAEVLERCAAAIGDLMPAADAPLGNGPAVYYRGPAAAGSVGVITPMTHSYCGSCNRVRLTADGRLRTCLFGTHEVGFRDPLRRGESIVPVFQRALAEKPPEHHLRQMDAGGLTALSQVGG